MYFNLLSLLGRIADWGEEYRLFSCTAISLQRLCHKINNSQHFYHKSQGTNLSENFGSCRYFSIERKSVCLIWRTLFVSKKISPDQKYRNSSLYEHLNYFHRDVLSYIGSARQLALRAQTCTKWIFYLALGARVHA